MKMKKVLSLGLALILAVVMVVSMVSCGVEVLPGDDDVTEYHIGVCQLVQHVALDAATEGFCDALNEALAGDNVSISIDVENAGGDSNNCATIVNGFVSSGVDLIMANATAALQAAASATDEIPVLGTSITDYGSALGIDFTGVIGTNVSGTSDLAPLSEQAAMIKELFPTATKVGILYCNAEANSVYQVNVITKELQALGLEVEAYSFNDSNDVTGVAETACSAAEGNNVLYIPTDNTAANNTEAIANVAIPAGMPIVAGEEGICSGCGVATLSINYYDLGYATGLMAAKILKGEANVSEMAVEYAPKVTKEYNKANCEALGITVPEDYVAIGE